MTSKEEDPEIVLGAHFHDWLDAIAQMPQVLNEDDVKSAWETITEFLRQTDQQELGQDYQTRRTWLRTLTDILIGPFAAFVTFWISALLLRPLGVVDLLPAAGLFCTGAALYYTSPASATTRRRTGVGVMSASAFIIVVLALLYLGSSMFHF